MPRWQHISYSAVVTDLMEKVHPGGDSLLQKSLREYTKNFKSGLPRKITKHIDITSHHRLHYE